MIKVVEFKTQDLGVCIASLLVLVIMFGNVHEGEKQ